MSNEFSSAAIRLVILLNRERFQLLSEELSFWKNYLFFYSYNPVAVSIANREIERIIDEAITLANEILLRERNRLERDPRRH